MRASGSGSSPRLSEEEAHEPSTPPPLYACHQDHTDAGYPKLSLYGEILETRI